MEEKVMHSTKNNISAQMLEVNDKFSSSKKTKHIKAKFFFIKDKVDSGEIKVKDCPTEDMWADIQSKPRCKGSCFESCERV